MKTNVKLSAFILALGLLFSACSASKQASSSPSAGQWRGNVKGQWVLDAVEKKNFIAGTNVKTIFDEAPIECFLGSTWNLIANGKGSITFSADGEVCAPGATRDIFWSIYKPDGGEGQFQFKKLYPGEKAKDVTEGYRLNLAYADGKSLVMQLPVSAGTNNAYLEFKFLKLD